MLTITWRPIFFYIYYYAIHRYKESGGKKLPLPLEVRWNSVTDSLRAYLDNWPKLIAVCAEHRDTMDKDIAKLINDVALKRNAEDYLSRMKPIAVALDRMQRADCTIADAVHIWKELYTELQPILSDADLRKVAKRMAANLTPDHHLAYLLTPKYHGELLTPGETDKVYEYVASLDSSFLPIVMKYQSHTSPFLPFRFLDSVTNDIQLQPVGWWKVIAGIDPQFLDYIIKLMTAINSSASIERVFSTFGFVHSKLRNRLGVEKAGKLVFIFRLLNTVDLTEE